MADPFPAVAESAARGEAAQLFADIRATVGVRVVNLVWRHLATMDGALPWAWAAVKPLYLAGVPDEATRRFRASMIVPRFEGLAGPQPRSVDDVLASYDHSNTVNLFALGALVAWLRGETATAGTPPCGPRLPAPDVTLPKLNSAEDVSPEVWALVLRLNAFGDKKQIILASMYRQLSGTPGFLALLESALSKAVDLDEAIAVNRAKASDMSRLVARAISAPPAPQAAQIERSVSAFVDHAIGKMITICRAIRQARGNLQ
ncbi:MAG TPA: hypothetical protein VFB13_00220 [Reyranella sp.]|nr:hypothetical protein [Reyranella sp.]